MHLSRITLITANIAKMKRFYRSLLGITPDEYRFGFAEFRTEEITLALWDQSEYEEYSEGMMQASSNRSVLLELEVTNADDEYNRLHALSLGWVQKPSNQPWGRRSFYILDPDNNVINIFSEIEKE